MANTGYIEYSTLVEYIVGTNTPTGQTKSNSPSDPDYVPPVLDSVECPTTTTTTIGPYVDSCSIVAYSRWVLGNNDVTETYDVGSVDGTIHLEYTVPKIVPSTDTVTITVEYNSSVIASIGGLSQLDSGVLSFSYIYVPTETTIKVTFSTTGGSANISTIVNCPVGDHNHLILEDSFHFLQEDGTSLFNLE